MSISGVSSSCSSTQTAFESVLNPKAEEFNSLSSSLSSGDLSAAQKAFDKLKENSGITDNNDRRVGGFDRLERALQAGNLAHAQQAFAALKADFQGNHEPNSSSADTTAPAVDPRSGVGTVVDVIA